MEEKLDVFLIISVISVIAKPLSYADNRSVFSEKERIEQTINSIKSIREKNPTAKILLVESGTKNFDFLFKDKVDKFLYIGNNKIVRYCVDSKFKGLGEAVILINTIKTLSKNKINRLFKLSGRYFLNGDFDEKKFKKDKFNFKIYDKGMSTRLYSIPTNKLVFFLLTQIISIPLLLLGVSIEQTYYYVFNLFRIKINSLEKLGVTGLISVNGENIKE